MPKPPHIAITAEAQQAAAEQLRDGEKLRIAFAGGCGAMGFRLAVARRPLDDDLPLELGGVSLLLDRQAQAQLAGATLDYDPDEGWLLDHPAWGVSC